MENYKKAYEELYEAVYGENRTKVEELSTFVAMKGNKYDSQKKVKLLIIGRATNGWGQLNLSDSKAFVQDAIKERENRHFDWVVCENNSLRNNELNNKGKYYYLTKSPFWRTTKRIWQILSDNQTFIDDTSNKWVDYVAWSNLYKVAPKETGNPSAALAKIQLEACKSILKAEIEEFAPTHILFVTGYEWWFEQFKEIFDVSWGAIKKNRYCKDKKNSFYAETVATMKNGTKVVVACRPECRDEMEYVNDIINAFE